MKIDRNHPRSVSLLAREKLVKSVRNNIASLSGLIAHGRGEAFDYLIGENTRSFARRAISAAAAYLVIAEKPILSINGNAAGLIADEYIELAKAIDCKIEVNLFHYSQKRVLAIEKMLNRKSAERILRSRNQEKIIIPEIASKRAIVIREGIGNSDCVFIPLEDGDRCRALRKMGKKVIVVDLNPKSRSALSASVTIVDNITRCIPLLIDDVKKMKNKKSRELRKIIKSYDNQKELENALKTIKNSTLFGR